MNEAGFILKTLAITHSPTTMWSQVKCIKAENTMIICYMLTDK